MTKRKLSIVSFVVYMVAAILLFFDGMYVLRHFFSSEHQENITFSFASATEFYEPLGFLILVIMLVFVFLNLILSLLLFKKNAEFLNRKVMIVLPILTLLLYVLTSIHVGLYEEQSLYVMYEETQAVWTSLGILFYIELFLLIIGVILECVKQYLKLPYSNNGYIEEEIKEEEQKEKEQKEKETIYHLQKILLTILSVLVIIVCGLLYTHKDKNSRYITRDEVECEVKNALGRYFMISALPDDVDISRMTFDVENVEECVFEVIGKMTVRNKWRDFDTVNYEAVVEYNDSKNEYEVSLYDIEAFDF